MREKLEVNIPKYFKGQIVSTLHFALRNKMATNTWGSSQVLRSHFVLKYFKS